MLPGFLDIHRFHLSHAAGMALVRRPDEAKRTLRGRDGLAVAPVSGKYNAVGEIGIQLGQVEHYAVTVRGADHGAKLYPRSAQALTERRARPAENLGHRNSIIRHGPTLFVRDR